MTINHIFMCVLLQGLFPLSICPPELTIYHLSENGIIMYILYCNLIFFSLDILCTSFGCITYSSASFIFLWMWSNYSDRLYHTYMTLMTAHGLLPVCWRDDVSGVCPFPSFITVTSLAQAHTDPHLDHWNSLLTGALFPLYTLLSRFYISDDDTFLPPNYHWLAPFVYTVKPKHHNFIALGLCTNKTGWLEQTHEKMHVHNILRH